VDFALNNRGLIRCNLLEEKRRELTNYRGEWGVLILRKALEESFLRQWGSP